MTWLILAPNLKHLEISDCDEMEEIINGGKLSERPERMGKVITFSKLKFLTLKHLPKLRSIYWSDLPLPDLKELAITDCPMLLPLPPHLLNKVHVLPDYFTFNYWVELLEVPSKSDSGSEKKHIKERVAFRTKLEVEIPEDGYKWRKYGKKVVKNSPNPRNYNKFSAEGCPMKKKVDRDRDDPSYNRKNEAPSFPATANSTLKTGSHWRLQQGANSWRPPSGNNGWRPSSFHSSRPPFNNTGPPNRGHQHAPRPYLGRCQSLHTLLDRPNSTTITSWVPSVITLSPSTAVLSPDLSPSAAPFCVTQEAPQLSSPAASSTVDPVPLSPRSAASSSSNSAAQSEPPSLFPPITASSESPTSAAAPRLSPTGCRALQFLSSTGRLPEALQHLEIQHCSQLTTIGQLPETLKRLDIKRLDSLSSAVKKKVPYAHLQCPVAVGSKWTIN
ncbi:hypothetical protein LWI28_001412 [Acer negundo]|uniref:WRKY domain-containing protein n=1 Tax=Acer negundo TaxID=4023 RepID=A0AAD5J2N0_ACENE|nr:hypothetical protein LWI28_001412 [Acer negundo]